MLSLVLPCEHYLLHSHRAEEHLVLKKPSISSYLCGFVLVEICLLHTVFGQHR